MSRRNEVLGGILAVLFYLHRGITSLRHVHRSVTFFKSWNLQLNLWGVKEEGRSGRTDANWPSRYPWVTRISETWPKGRGNTQPRARWRMSVLVDISERLLKAGSSHFLPVQSLPCPWYVHTHSRRAGKVNQKTEAMQQVCICRVSDFSMNSAIYKGSD